jgi:CHAD domain-containing protein
LARKTIPPETDFRTFGEGVVGERLRRMLSFADAVRLGEDIEALHDMRVASRRTRAAISVFESAFADPDLAAFERETRTVTRALGTARDLDVMIETLEQLENELPASARAGFERLIDSKRRTRADLQAGVVRALGRMQKHNLDAWFGQIAARARGEVVPRARRGGPSQEQEPQFALATTDAAPDAAPVGEDTSGGKQ